MEKDKDTLNGFQAFFDTMNPNVGKDDNDKIDLSQNEPLTDEELDAIRNNSKPEDQPKAGKNKEKNQKEEDIEEDDETIEDDEIDEEPVNKKETKKDKKDKSTKEEDKILRKTMMKMNQHLMKKMQLQDSLKFFLKNQVGLQRKMMMFHKQLKTQ